MDVKYEIKGRKMEDMNILVTGGAGVIGSNLIRKIPGNVTVIDNLSSSKREDIEALMKERKVSFFKMDVRNIEALQKVSKGMDLIIHLAANADVRYYDGKDTGDDFMINTIGTYNVMEAMRKNDIKNLIFSSSSSVYGLAETIPTPESYGPLITESLYAGSKLGGEGIISSFSNMFGFNSWIFRFANIVAPNYRTVGMNVVPDLILKLRRDGKSLELLGNGRQRKSYLYVDDCIRGMIHLSDASPKNVDIFNLGNRDSITVDEIAGIIVKEMGMENVEFKYTGGDRGWTGDIPTTVLDIRKALDLGWEPTLGSADAVRKSARMIIEAMNH